LQLTYPARYLDDAPSPDIFTSIEYLSYFRIPGRRHT